MQGQWLGRYQGNTNGVVTIELDDLGDHYEGMAYVYPADAAMFPPIAGAVTTVDKSLEFSLQIKVDVIDLQHGFLVPWNAIKHKYPNVTLAPTIDTIWSCDANSNVLEIAFNGQSGGRKGAPTT